MMRLCDCGCGEQTPLAAKTDRRKGHVRGEPLRYIQGHFGRTIRYGRANVQGKDVELPITEETVATIRKWERKRAAKFYDSRIRRIELLQRTSYIEQGLILNEVSDQELFREIVDPETNFPYTSFDRWLMEAAPVSRSGGYSAMKALRELQDVPMERLRQMPRCNVEVMRGLSLMVRRDPEILQAAARESEKGFIQTIKDLHPDQHVEQRPKLTMKPTESARSVIEQAIDVAKWAYEVQTREDATENIATFFLEGPCEREGYSNRTNREAFQAAKKRGAA